MKPLILIVDDNVSYVERMLSILSEDFNAAAFHTATNYEDATALINELNPQIAMLDINLPGKSGIDILNFIKQSNSDCRVIMITNHAFESYRKKCMDLGAEHFLDKSADFEKISSILTEMLAQSN
ncbi:response regulator transcription factor [Lacibacter sp.]|uniref:response regulator transcription factor n=1 Tax=Lacibacter sp. TaxID=1915409 RepID=UPI002B4AB90F|nr:response regulator [Lacibacter sp.]HLP36449.1 response regulator [Lacibacter sp.]